MAFLYLEDGSLWEGKSFGAWHNTIGEVVFNTGMTGYQEILTDPSYYGQIVTMTYPLIGNYGYNMEDVESIKPYVKGFVVREFCRHPSNWMSQGTLDNFLQKHHIMGIEGIDTRALTRRIRKNGTMKGIITLDKPTKMQILELSTYSLYNPVRKVTATLPYEIVGNGSKVAIMDFGAKQNIIRTLQGKGCHLYVFPAETTADDIMKVKPAGIMLTNGPGDPKDNVKAIQTIQLLMNRIPIFGICLGHQLLGLASGGNTEKLKFGHRGCNHPVKDIKKDRVYITSQNHGYTIVESSLQDNIEITHRNLNDGTIEGMRYKNRPIFSVQFHPEACPGPQDTEYLFDEFMSLIR